MNISSDVLLLSRVLLLFRVLNVLIINIYLKLVYIFVREVIFRNFHFTLEHSETKIEIWKEDKKLWNDALYFYLLIKTCSHQLSNKAKIWEQEASLDSVLLTVNWSLFGHSRCLINVWGNKGVESVCPENYPIDF